MPDNLINTEKDIGTSTLTFSQLRQRYYTGRNLTISGEGRDRKTKYRTGVMTEIGDIEIFIWEKMVYELIVKSNELPLFERLMAWCRKEPFLLNEAERKTYALTLHAARLFENKEWAGYTDFHENSPAKLIKEKK